MSFKLEKIRAVLIDHQDSFTWNIFAWLSSRCEVSIINHTEILNIKINDFDLIVISPGPKSPSDYPLTQKFIKSLDKGKAVLGICLGMQFMIASENGVILPYSPPLHGKTSHLQSSVKQLNSLKIARYHSLECKIDETKFELIAMSDQIPMIIKHKQKKWLGFQFHPESFLTENAEVILNYLNEALL